MEWIIQDIFGSETDGLVEALKNNNIPYYVGLPKYLKPGQKYMFRGSVEFVKQYQRFCQSYNHVLFDNFRCSRYYHYFKELMFNHDFILIPKGCLLQNKDILPWKNNEKVFIRPDSGCKEFTGTTICKKWFEKDLEIVLKNVPDNKLILISSVKDSIEEFRAVIGPNGLTSISNKSFNGGNISKNFLVKVYDFCKNFDFPPIAAFYTIDFCEVDGMLRIMECNSFNCAGLYDVDYDKVVKSISSHYLE